MEHVKKVPGVYSHVDNVNSKPLMSIYSSSFKLDLCRLHLSSKKQNMKLSMGEISRYDKTEKRRQKITRTH